MNNRQNLPFLALVLCEMLSVAAHCSCCVCLFSSFSYLLYSVNCYVSFLVLLSFLMRLTGFYEL